MHQLIATYLFQHKQCPLPGLGHLYVQQSPAQTDFVNSQIIAPKAEIKFSSTPLDIEPFLQYASSIKNSNTEVVKNELHQLLSKNKFIVSGVGEFDNTDNIIKFTSITIDENITQSTYAERVVHENEAHSMVVGDTETTTTAMTEYFAEDEIKKDYWWVWALVLGGISIATICIYYFAGFN